MLAREFGLQRNHVEAIKMEEARSGALFCDTDSIIGLLEACAWTLGCLLGGRRPRTLTAMRAEDVVFKVQETTVGGGSRLTRVVKAKVLFREEEVCDAKGLGSYRIG